MRPVQMLDSAANMRTSVPDPSPLTSTTIGDLGFDQLRGPLLTEAFRKKNEYRNRFVNPLFSKNAKIVNQESNEETAMKFQHSEN
jgi:hypothetical protein